MFPEKGTFWGVTKTLVAEIKLRVSAPLLEKMKAAALAAEQPLSTWVRQLIVAALQQRK